MSLLQPELPVPHRPSVGHQIAGPALLVGSVLLFVGIGFALGSGSAPVPVRPVADPCALPSGVSVDALATRDAALIARRLLACSDYHHGRITIDGYREAIGAIDKQWAGASQPRPAVVWASTVRGFSTQYSPDSWSAHQVIGAPDVYPGHGDNVNAWASLGADDRDEWLEVGFADAGSVSGVEIYETFNPGAVDRVELVTASGRTIVVRPDRARTGLNAKTTLPVQCTSEAIVAARVHIASMRVAGWNEIDAIGVIPCR